MGSDVRKMTVIGAGTMGHGIAQVAAMARIEAVLYDIDASAVERGLDQIRANLDKGVARSKIDESTRQASLGMLTGSSDLTSAMRDVDLVIEAVPEDEQLKARVLSAAAAAAPANAIIATNTSSIRIGNLAAPLPDPGRVIGMHFFNPVHLMKLVEIVRGEDTHPETVEAAVDVSERMGKTPIVVKDSPGFASSRLGIALGLEAMRMVEEGVASPSDIDTAMELGYRHPMGPLRLTDLVGLDVRLAIADYLHEELGTEAFRAPAILRNLVSEGKLGQKTGHGFYDWSKDVS